MYQTKTLHCSGILANSIMIHFTCLHIIFPPKLLLEQQCTMAKINAFSTLWAAKESINTIF